MKSAKIAWGLAAVMTAASAYLFFVNRSLRADRAGDVPAAEAELADDSRAEAKTGDTRVTRAIDKAAKAANARADRPELPDKPKVDRRERRMRMQENIRAMFGRLDGETPEQYKERMVPLIEGVLAMPRERLEEERARLEKLAKVSDDQREEMEKVFADAHAEALELTNTAVAEGDLTPYERNWAGTLTYGGGLAAVLQSAETRMSEILSPEQAGIFYDGGFEWGEYLGVKMPWERLDPPPPPPS